MNPKRILPSIVLFALALALPGCRKPVPSSASGGEGVRFESNAKPEIVNSCAGGYISSEARILAHFVDDMVGQDKVGAKTAIAALSPGAPGEFLWTDSRTLEFKPSKPLPRGTYYRVDVRLSKLDPSKFQAASDFYFTFQLLAQGCSLDAEGFAPASPTDLVGIVFNGRLVTADVADAQEVEKAASFSQGNAKLKVSWTHSKIDHRFTVSGMVKKDKAQPALSIDCKGSSLGLDAPIHQEYEVPILAPFSAKGATAIETPERFIRVDFSDPLLANQDYRGLISTEPEVKLRFASESASLKVYAVDAWPDEVAFTARKGVKNVAGTPTTEDVTYRLSFTPVQPQVRFIGKGVIVPKKAGVTIPIETVNVSGVIVEIQKIYADKIDQFLQVNDLDGGSEVQRVGKTVWKKIVPVPFSESKRNQWIRTALDLSPLLADDGHSLYRVNLSLDIRMSEYPGADIPEEQLKKHSLERLELSKPSPDIRALGDAFWEDYDAYWLKRKSRNRYYDDYYGDSENAAPVNRSSYFAGYNYYEERTKRPSVKASRNLLLSDIGLIAQGDANGELTLAAASLLTAEPLKDADVAAYDFQGQLVVKGRTDGSGFASLKPDRDPFMVIAEKDGQRGYLKLSGASLIPVSHFDVAGQEVQRGVKGFVYGERGVWRPGDPIYLTLIVQDKYSALPKDYPVVLRFYDPKGRLVDTVRNVKPVGDFYHFPLKTAKDDPTGTYQAKIQVGGAVFTKDVPVETIKPNRLKIEIGFSGNPKELLASKPVAAEMKVAWLHGAVAGDMDYDVSVRYSPIPTVFEGFKDYAFDDPIRSFRSESKEVAKGSLDSKGTAGFTPTLSPNAISPGKLMATFRTRVTEPGGNINGDTFSQPFSPYDEYVGISVPDLSPVDGSLDVQDSHMVKIALVDSAGKAVKDGEVEISVYHIGWRWWWDRSDDYVADYLGREYYDLVGSGTVKVSKGLAEWKLQVENPHGCRYIIRAASKSSGHTTGKIVYFTYPGWYYSGEDAKGDSAGGDGADVLAFSSDKKSYKVGETAKLSIPVPADGRALVSIENDGKIISSEWISAKAGTAVYPLKLTEAMTPNVYAHVSLIQPHGQTVNDRPIRMYGVLPVMVEDPSSKLSPAVATAESYEPGGKARITVSEASGKPMTYTLAMVDEGLLNITRFKTPNPWEQFYKRDALAVSTFDVYGFVAAAFGGKLESLLAIGGGDDGDSGDGRKANRFPPVVKYLGPFVLEKGAKAEHLIDMPQYVGAVRVMVVAANEAAYGAAEKTVPVKKAVMTAATLPRVASIGETIALPVSVFALDDGIKSVDVTVKAGGRLSVSGESRKAVAFERSGDKLVSFELAASGRPGIGTVEIKASSGKVETTQSIEIDVRVPTAAVTKVDGLSIPPQGSIDHKVAFVGIPGSNAVSIEVSKVLPIDLGRRLSYLIQYPYGCIEQTTSGAFPQLYLDRIADLSTAEKAEARRNVQAGVDRLTKFQTGSGGLSYWPGETAASFYGTTYAGHFILEAEALGYMVPSAMKRGLVKYLKAQAGAGNWGTARDDLLQAYALFDLALAGEPDLGAMNRLREKQGLDPGSRFKLAAAYALSGQKDEAQRLVSGSLPTIAPYSELGGTYGSDLRDRAILAEGLTAVGAYDAAIPLIQEISKALERDYWYSTQSTAYCLIAIGKYLAVYSTGAPVEFSYTWAGSANAVKTDAAIKRIRLPVSVDSAPAALSIASKCSEPLYVRVIRTGLPAPGELRASEKGVSLRVDYLDRDLRGLSISSLPQGTDVIADIVVKNLTDRYLEEMALEYIAPSGWEIANPRFEGDGDRIVSSFDFQDVRDDRVDTFFDLRGGEEKRLRIMLTASYAGRFYLPQSKLEAMYESSISSLTESGWITVYSTEPGEK